MMEKENSQEESKELVTTTKSSLDANKDHKTANIIFNSSAVPQQIRGDVGAVFAVMQMGREMGIGPMRALNTFVMVNGNLGTKTEYKKARIFSAGHSIEYKEATSEKCTVVGTRGDTGVKHEVTWTIDDAKTAGLLGKDNWKKYPRAMLKARAVSELARDLFADCLEGLSYDYDELDEIVEQVQTKKEKPQPKSMAEAVEVVTTGTIEEAESIEDIPASHLASSPEVKELMKLRTRMGYTKKQAEDLDEWMKQEGYSFGTLNGDVHKDYRVPLDAIEKIKSRIHGIKGELPREGKPNTEAITEKQLNKILAMTNNLSDEDQAKEKEARELKYPGKSRKDFTKKEASEHIKYLESFGAEK